MSGRTKILAIFLLTIVYLKHGESTDETSAVVGHRATLPCYVDLSGNIQVSWFSPDNTQLTHNENVLTGDRRFSVHHYYKEWNLVIDEVRRTDEGVYHCAIQTTPVQTKSVRLWVHNPPKITDSSPDLRTRVGRNATLFCTATGIPTPTVKWFHHVFSGARESTGQAGEFLQLYNLTREEAGDYECEAENGVSPKATAFIKVDVHFASEVRLPYETVIQEQGRETLLQCMIASNPYQSYYWQKDGVRLGDSLKYKVQTWDVGQYSKSLGVLIRDLTEDDFGQYMCVAENQYGKSQKALHMYESVKKKVKVTSPPVDVISDMGYDVTMNCTVQGMSGKDTLIWWYNHPVEGDRKLFSTKSSSQSQRRKLGDKYQVKGHYNLLVKNITMDDAGQYTCEIENYRNFSANIIVVDELVCESNRTTYGVGEQVEITCQLPFAGLGDHSAVPWRMGWNRKDYRLSSINLDTDTVAKRMFSFRVSKHQAGMYACNISSHKPSYAATCQLNITVEEREPSAKPVCANKIGDMDEALFWVILGVTLTVVLVIFVLILAGVIRHYRSLMRKCSISEPSARYKNGNVSVETDMLTKPNDPQDV